ncbi:MAG TPA: hypothetical protein PKA16_05880 [Ottowia sp.]|uniref:hypothetical protein n=1 Tax=Ottowia sp. TaxID=1898956 RepID=UPI002CFF7D8B|nr:hypothetical protein [Ottowia sp.]HMN20906.1 hypothetical protein [Ottowia sp.]
MVGSRASWWRRLPGWAWALPWLVLAALMWAWAWPMQWQRACWMGEWPFEEGCPRVPRGAAVDNPPEVYRHYLAQNVGDSRALVWLARALWNTHDAAARPLLPWALRLAPQHPHALAMQADAQLQAGDWTGAAGTLIDLVESGQPQARQALLALMATPATQEAVLARLTPDARWLDPLLAGLDRARPVQALLPFVSRGQALGLLKPATLLGIIDRLKGEHAWIDAYALWVSWQGEVRAGLYNGGFDQPMLRRGFDWEWVEQPAARQGLRIEQLPALPNPGQMLELRLTGRAALPVPLLAQTLVLPGPRYRLRGQYLARDLVTQEGLVWALRCASGGERWAQSAPLLDTRGRWQGFEITFQPPPECGAAVALRLEPTAPWEARAGMLGTVLLDDFTIESMPSDLDAGAAPRANRS